MFTFADDAALVGFTIKEDKIEDEGMQSSVITV